MVNIVNIHIHMRVMIMGKVIKLKKVVIKNIHGNTIGIFPD